MASHGADQLIVQRLLACRGLKDARKALIGSGFVVLVQMAPLPLDRGHALRLLPRPADRSAPPPGAFRAPDEIFPTFIVRHLPAFISAYLVAGIFSAAMCSESSALNSLASALAHDVVGPMAASERLEGKSGLRSRPGADALLDGRCWRFSRSDSRASRSRSRPSRSAWVCSRVTAGGLLGAFLLAIYARRARQADVLWGVACSTVFMLALFLGSKGWIPLPLGQKIAWPWYSLIGSSRSPSRSAAFSRCGTGCHEGHCRSRRHARAGAPAGAPALPGARGQAGRRRARD